MEISEPAPWVAGPPAGEEGGGTSPQVGGGRPGDLQRVLDTLIKHFTYTAYILKCSNT